jgi:hypothetical protein
MRAFSRTYRFAAAVLLIGVAVAGPYHEAAAASTYNASAWLTITLDSILDSNGQPVTSQSVLVTQEVTGSVAATATAPGDFASASRSPDVSPPVDLGLGGTLTQTTSVNGVSVLWNGFAESVADSLGSIVLFNGTTDQVTFNFSWALQVVANAIADPQGDAFALATVQVFDSQQAMDIGPIGAAAIADGIFGPFSDALVDSGLFSITLAAGDTDTIGTEVYSYGYAIPEPGLLGLLGLGLAGMVAGRGRKGLPA